MRKKLSFNWQSLAAYDFAMYRRAIENGTAKIGAEIGTVTCGNVTVRLYAGTHPSIFGSRHVEAIRFEAWLPMGYAQHRCGIPAIPLEDGVIEEKRPDCICVSNCGQMEYAEFKEAVEDTLSRMLEQKGLDDWCLAYEEVRRPLHEKAAGFVRLLAAAALG